ncbi:uncharacterized protein LOC141910267 [Tubulanus polymorphus]|uniref:uncharacterized protein LOC141910267 n=1 Tax=Tubulanus polymorphus TaxID=672921 RepID=UPI003DA4A8C6
MEKMPSRPFKLLVGKGTQEKVPIIATSYEDLLQKVCEKLNCEGVLYTEDHTEITAEYYDFLENFTVVYLKASPDVSEIESIESEPDIAAVREITVQKTLVDFGTMDTEKHKAHIQRQTKILAEHGKNANYNKEINKTCYKLVLKTPELLNKGNRGTLLKNARLEVNKVYPFKRKRRHANADSGPKPKLSKKCRQQRIADINDRSATDPVIRY